MRIQRITPINFTTNDMSNRRTSVDRAVTVQDIYEMEDRINSRNAEIIKHQNEQISKLVMSQVKYYIHPCPENYNILKCDIKNLKTEPVGKF